MLASPGMVYLTMDAEIDHGRIIAAEPQKLPPAARALLTVLEPVQRKPDLAKIKSLLGSLKTSVGAVEWQRQVRAEWDRS